MVREAAQAAAAVRVAAELAVVVEPAVELVREPAAALVRAVELAVADLVQELGLVVAAKHLESG
jgi:ABC-type arginine transport system ATPase subunit